MIIIKSPNHLQGAMTDPTFGVAGLDVEALNQIDVVLNGTKVSTKSFKGIDSALVNVGGYVIREAQPKPPSRSVGVISLPWALHSVAIRGDGFSSEPIKISLGKGESVPINRALSDGATKIALARNSINVICLAPSVRPSATITLMGIDKEYSLEMPNSYTEGMAAVVTDFQTIGQMLHDADDSIDNYHSAKLTITINNNTISRRYRFITQSASTIVWINRYGVWESFSPLQLTKRVVSSKQETTTESCELSSPLLPASQLAALHGLSQTEAAWITTTDGFESIAIAESSIELDNTKGSAPKIKIVKTTKTNYRWL